MTQDIIAMAREAGFQSAEFWPDDFKGLMGCVERFAALAQAAERNKLAAWMQAQGYATGHGDTIEGLLEELEREVGFKRAELWLKRINEAVLAEREACAKLCEEVLEQYRGTAMGKNAELVGDDCAAAIRARGQA
jgi:hypothetical protein